MHTPQEFPAGRSQVITLLEKGLIIADHLRQAGLPDQARKLEDCTKVRTLWLCEGCKSHWYVPIHCHSRLCPVCNATKSRKNAMLALTLFGRAQSPRWCTLTMKRVQDLHEGVQRVRHALRNLRHSPRFRNVIAGGFYQIEIKPKPDGWHVHVHCLLDSKYLVWRQLMAAWCRGIRQPWASIDIQRVTGRQVVAYVTKYVTKPADIIDMAPHQLRQFVAATHRLRLCATFGTWYNVTLAKLLELPPPTLCICPHCLRPDLCYPARAGPRHWPQYWTEFRAMYWPNLATNEPDPDYAWLTGPQACHVVAAPDDWF